MNKNDFDRFWTSCVPREARASNENIFDDVINSLALSLFIVQLSHLYMTTGKTIL